MLKNHVGKSKNTVETISNLNGFNEMVSETESCVVYLEGVSPRHTITVQDSRSSKMDETCQLVSI